MTTKKHDGAALDQPDTILIVGGGFCRCDLGAKPRTLVAKQVEVIVVSAVNHLVFTPMLPEVSGGPSLPFMSLWPVAR